MKFKHGSNWKTKRPDGGNRHQCCFETSGPRVGDRARPLTPPPRAQLELLYDPLLQLFHNSFTHITTNPDISLYLLSHNCSQSIRLNRSATFLIIFSSTSSTVLVFILWHSNAATSLLTGFQKLHLDCSCVVVV